MLSQAASQVVVPGTTAREDVRGHVKLASGVNRLHSLSPLLFSDGIRTIIQFVLLSLRIPDRVCVGDKQDKDHDQNESV